MLFSAIVGVPEDLAAIYDDNGDPPLSLDDDDARERRYATMLADPRMVERVDDSDASAAKWRIEPSCGDDGMGSTASADPPRRIVELARRFGPNGVVQSICQDDFSAPIDALLRRVVHRLGPVVCQE